MRCRRCWPLALLALAACEPYGVQIHTVAASVQRPANVAAYLEISDGGAPLANLGADAFHVYEDGRLLDAQQIGLALLPRDAVAARRALLLVDVTGDKTGLSKAVTAFVQAAKQPVSVYAFDGSPKIRRVEPGQLAAVTPKDPSRDLRGAILQGLAELDDELAGDGRPVRVGTLIVFAAGPDLAGRVTRHDLDAALERTPHQIVAVGTGKATELDDVGRDGTFTGPALDADFHDAAARVAALAAGQYVVAYCSPARGGMHDVRIQVDIPAAGRSARSAEARLRFSAAGFAAGCASHTTPRFLVTLLGSGDKLAAGIAPEGGAPTARPVEHAHHASHAAPSPTKPKPHDDFEP